MVHNDNGLCHRRGSQKHRKRASIEINHWTISQYFLHKLLPSSNFPAFQTVFFDQLLSRDAGV